MTRRTCAVKRAQDETGASAHGYQVAFAGENLIAECGSTGFL